MASQPPPYLLADESEGEENKCPQTSFHNLPDKASWSIVKHLLPKA
jgi:hypothetical protein